MLNKKVHQILKYVLIVLVLAIDAYLVMLMYAQGEYLFAIFTLIIITSGVYIFSSQKTYSWRYVFPGAMGMVIFILFPLVATVTIAFTNYSGIHQLSFQRALNVLLEQRYFSGDKFNYQLIEKSAETFDLVLINPKSQETFIAFDIQLTDEKVNLTQGEKPIQKPLPFKAIIQLRKELQDLHAFLPDGRELSMSSLRQFSEQMPRYTFNKDNQVLTNHQINERYLPNNDTGFFQQIDNEGNFLDKKIEPGFIVTIGWKNFIRIFTDEGVSKPFLQIFIWTISFAALTVLFTTLLGMVLACLVQWQPLQGKAIYRLLLILPYAVPSFISILVFKGLFNQSFGEINVILETLFGIRPQWFNDPFLAKSMLLIVNTWLGYPYVMILCMGLLKAIPQDLYEASAIDGASVFQNFRNITMPLLLKPLAPLMIASFAFNFNNFVVVDLLTKGAPDIIGTTTPAGHTDLLVNYTYRMAFDGSGTQDFGLAAAIATMIFLLVGGLALLNMKASQMKLD